LKIVNCCGFDSIPSDLGVMMMTTEMKKRNLEPVEIRQVLKGSKGGVSGGTIASVINLIESSSSETLMATTNPYFLCPRETQTGKQLEATEGAVKTQNMDSFGFAYDKIEETWEMPWIMQSINTRVVHRSNALSGHKYGRNLIYREVMGAPNAAVALFVSMLYPFVGALLYFPPTRAIIKRLLPRQGDGPSKEERETGFYKINFWGIGRKPGSSEDVIVRGSVSSQNEDPGYKGTAKLIAESAVCLAKDASTLPATYGVLTPSTAMGEAILNRLRKKNVKFEVNA
jgi:short subunit dehydrogenase-like uncharacterized protein